jgi:hypothetical protein
MIRLWASATAVLITLAACESNTAEERLRAHLGLPGTVQLSEQTIREAFLRKIPVGTAVQEVERRLSEAGVGKDKLSSYVGPDASRTAYLRVDFDPRTLGVVKTHYEIPLNFSPDMKLSDVEVKIWRTGL